LQGLISPFASRRSASAINDRRSPGSSLGLAEANPMDFIAAANSNIKAIENTNKLNFERPVYVVWVAFIIRFHGVREL